MHTFLQFIGHPKSLFCVGPQDLFLVGKGHLPLPLEEHYTCVAICYICTLVHYTGCTLGLTLKGPSTSGSFVLAPEWKTIKTPSKQTVGLFALTELH